MNRSLICAVAIAAMAAREARASEPQAAAIVPRRFVQGGVAFSADFVAAPGGICSTVAAACIFGSGGGISARTGIRTSGPFYFGLAYGFSKLDPSQLYRLAIFQQLRAEARFYFLGAHLDADPYVIGALVVAAYGNEWKVDTGGPSVSLGLGTEAQISTTTLVGVSLTYRAIYSARFTDGAGSTRADGIAQLVSLEVLLEGRDPFSR